MEKRFYLKMCHIFHVTKRSNEWMCLETAHDEFVIHHLVNSTFFSIAHTCRWKNMRFFLRMNSYEMSKTDDKFGIKKASTIITEKHVLISVFSIGYWYNSKKNSLQTKKSTNISTKYAVYKVWERKKRVADKSTVWVSRSMLILICISLAGNKLS